MVEMNARTRTEFGCRSFSPGAVPLSTRHSLFARPLWQPTQRAALKAHSIGALRLRDCRRRRAELSVHGLGLLCYAVCRGVERGHCNRRAAGLLCGLVCRSPKCHCNLSKTVQVHEKHLPCIASAQTSQQCFHLVWRQAFY